MIIFLNIIMLRTPLQYFFPLVFWFYNQSDCNKFLNQRKGTILVLAAVVLISLVAKPKIILNSNIWKLAWKSVWIVSFHFLSFYHWGIVMFNPTWNLRDKEKNSVRKNGILKVCSLGSWNCPWLPFSSPGF